MPAGLAPSMAAVRSVWRASAVTPAARGPLPQTSPIASIQTPSRSANTS